MKKWILPAFIAALVLLAAYVIGGPYLAIRGISQAIEQRDTGKLARHVDFGAVRVNIKAQLNLTGAGVDTFVTPLGIAALLQGDILWKRAIGDTVGGDTWAPPSPAKPLANTTGHYESLSRYTATTRLEDGSEVVFILSRQGLRWRLTNIVLPLGQAPG